MKESRIEMFAHYEDQIEFCYRKVDGGKTHNIVFTINLDEAERMRSCLNHVIESCFE